MSATYTPVTTREITELLKAEKGWRQVELPRVSERVYEYRLKRDPRIAIRVYSGIELHADQCRPCGADAIRVVAVNTQARRYMGEWVEAPARGKVARVHRTQNWRKNLQKRITDLIVTFNPAPSQAPARNVDAVAQRAEEVAFWERWLSVSGI